MTAVNFGSSFPGCCSNGLFGAFWPTGNRSGVPPEFLSGFSRESSRGLTFLGVPSTPCWESWCRVWESTRCLLLLSDTSRAGRKGLALIETVLATWSRDASVKGVRDSSRAGPGELDRYIGAFGRSVVCDEAGALWRKLWVLPSGLSPADWEDWWESRLMNRDKDRSRLGDANSLLKRGSRKRCEPGRSLTLKTAAFGQVRLGCLWTSKRHHLSYVTCAKLNITQVATSKTLVASDEDADAASGTTLGIGLVS